MTLDGSDNGCWDTFSLATVTGSRGKDEFSTIIAKIEVEAGSNAIHHIRIQVQHTRTPKLVSAGIRAYYGCTQILIGQFGYKRYCSQASTTKPVSLATLMVSFSAMYWPQCPRTTRLRPTWTLLLVSQTKRENGTIIVQGSAKISRNLYVL